MIQDLGLLNELTVNECDCFSRVLRFERSPFAWDNNPLPVS
ncbi:hypothetical protein [Allocoleopsis sp.]